MIQAPDDMVIVRPVFEKKSGIIFLPDQSLKTQADFHGIVVSVGPNYPHRDEVKPGDKVLYRRHEGTEINTGEEILLSLKKDWVVAKEEANV